MERTKKISYAHISRAKPGFKFWVRCVALPSPRGNRPSLVSNRRGPLHLGARLGSHSAGVIFVSAAGHFTSALNGGASAGSPRPNGSGSSERPRRTADGRARAGRRPARVEGHRHATHRERGALTLMKKFTTRSSPPRSPVRHAQKSWAALNVSKRVQHFFQQPSCLRFATTWTGSTCLTRYRSQSNRFIITTGVFAFIKTLVSGASSP